MMAWLSGGGVGGGGGRAAGQLAAAARKTCRSFDGDSDGLLDADELLAAFTSMAKSR
jgi:hypothetical protein